MADFDAGSIIEGISYDFTAYGGGKGAIPEPTSAQLHRFQRHMVESGRREQERVMAINRWQLQVQAANREGEPAPPMPAMPSDEEQRVVEDLDAEALADVCSDHPSKEEILKLPSRVLRAFYGYVTGHFLDPNVSTVAMRRSPAAPTVDEPVSS